jgi:hypothetical protein
VGLALDYDPVTHAAKGLLCEPQATNLILDGNAFGSVNWNANECTVASNSTTAPDGTMTADAIVPNAGSVNAYLFNGSVTVTSGAPYTASLFLKNGTLGNNWFHIDNYSGVVFKAWFNLATGAKGSSAASPTSWNITALPNSWYRIDLTITAGSATSQWYLMAAPADASAGNVTGDGVKPACYLWGAQLETGTVATSYIPTLAASVTRAADLCLCTAASINYSATAVAATTDAGATAGILAPVQIYFGVANMNGWIRKLRYLPRRPSNAELAVMST